MYRLVHEWGMEERLIFRHQQKLQMQECVLTNMDRLLDGWFDSENQEKVCFKSSKLYNILLDMFA